MLPNSLEKRDTRPMVCKSDEILLVSCIRNERKRLPYFLQYYRGLGIDRFLFIDNASNDGSSQFLLDQPDVHLFFTAESYAESRCGVDWLNALLQMYGTEHWVVVVDADELLVYPDSEYLGLTQLVDYLDRRNEQAMMTFMLDMYGCGPITAVEYRTGTPFLDSCPYFDGDSYQFPANGPFKHVPVRGGVRKRLFFNRENLRGKPPVLTKIPLVRWRADLCFEASTHILRNARMAEVTGALLHFKLFSDFSDRVQEEIAREEHWDNAAQYEAYGLAMHDDPGQNPMYEGTLRYRNSQQLLELGFLRRPDGYPESEQTRL